MKRISLKALVKDEVTKERIHFDGLMEIESYEEKDIPREKSVIEEHSFEELFEGIVEMANALWDFVKGAFKVSKWAIILVVEGLKYLWKNGVGAKDKDKGGKTNGKDEKGKGK